MASMFKKRKSKGRQKIEIKKIEKEEARQICFSKRKAGIFKKANELAVLCGAEVGIVAFSPAGKAFSFGHPNIHPVIDRYLAAGEASTTQDLYLHHPGTYYVHEANMRDLQREHEDLVTLVTAVKRQQGEMKKKLWWDDIEGLGVEDLMEYVKVLEQLKMKVLNRAAEMNKGLHGGVVHPGYGSDEMRRVEALNLQPMSSVHPGFGSDEMRRVEALNLQPMISSVQLHPGYGSDEMRRAEGLNLQPMSSVHPGYGSDDQMRRAECLSLHANSVHPGLYLDGFSETLSGHNGLSAGVLPGCSFGGLGHEMSRSVESLHAGVLPGCSFGGLDHEMRSTVESLHAGFGQGFF